MDPEKGKNNAHVLIKKNNIYKVEFQKTLILNQVIRQKELESINLSATNGTFVTKGKIESNFLTILTDKPKLNH